METNGTVPAQADQGSSASGQNEPNLGDILRNSPIWDKLQGSLPTDDVPAPDDSVDDDEDVPSTDGDGNANDEDDVGDDAEGQDDTKDSKDTPTNELLTEDEIDWEYKVPVKIDGKVQHLTLEEIRKGYATQQSLSAKGRELGEERKQLDSAREEKLQEVIRLGTTLHAELGSSIEEAAGEYHALKQSMEKAIEDGDGYTAKEIKEKLSDAQKKYWTVKNRQSKLEEEVAAQVNSAQSEALEQNAKYFADNIGKVLPSFTPELGGKIRDFALAEGLPQEVLNQVYEPKIIKMLHDYMTLKNKSETGAAKRKEAVSKSVPTKKGIPQKAQNQRDNANLRGKVLLGEGSKDDQLNFLKGLSKIGSKLR